VRSSAYPISDAVIACRPRGTLKVESSVAAGFADDRLTSTEIRYTLDWFFRPVVDYEADDGARSAESLCRRFARAPGWRSR
jgi:hypothetical protein